VHPEKTEHAFRELLPHAKESSDLAYYAELLTQIGRTLGLQRKFDDAHKTLDEALPLLDEAHPRARVRYMLERGRVFNSAGEKDKAKPLFIDAWNIARNANEDVFAVDAAHMIAIIETSDEALKWSETAVAFAEQSPNIAAKNWLGSLYNNIGWTYHGKGEYKKALDYF